MKIPTILLSLFFCCVAVSSEIQQQKKSNGQTEKRVGVETTVKRSHVTDVEAASRNVQTKRSLEVGQQKSRSKEAGLSFQETGSAQKTSSGTDWGGLLPDAEEKDRKKQSEVSPIIAWLGNLRASKSNEQISLHRGPYWDSFTSEDAKYTRLDQAEKLGDKPINDNWYMYLIPESSEDYSESLAPGRSAIIQSQQRNGQWISSGTNLRWKEGPEWSNRGKKIKNEDASARWRMQKLPTSQWNTDWKKENLKEIKGNEGSRIDWKRERNSQWKNSGLDVKNWKINEDNSKKSEGSSRSLEGLRSKSEKSLDSSDDRKANEEGERINKYLKHKTLFDSDPLLLLDELEHGSKYKHKGTGRYDTMLHGDKAHDKMYESNRYIGNRRGSDKVDELPEMLKLKGWREEDEKMKAEREHSSKKIQLEKPSKETSDDRIKTLWSTRQSDKIQGKNDEKHRILVINKKIPDEKLKSHELKSWKSKILAGEQRNQYSQRGEDKTISSEEKKSEKDESGGARSHMWKSNMEQKVPQRNRESKEKEENNLQKEKIAAGKSGIEDLGKQEHGPRGWKMYKPLKDSKEKISRGDGFEVRKWSAEIPDENRHWKQNLRQQVLKTEDAGWWKPSSDHWNNKGLKTASPEQQMLGLQNIERNNHIMEVSQNKELEEDSRKKNEEEENIKTGRWESEKIKKQTTEIVNYGLKESDKEKPEMKDLLLKKSKSEMAEKKKIQEQREEKSSEEKKTKKLEIHKPEDQGWNQKEKSEQSEKKEVHVESENKGLRKIELKGIEVEKPQGQGWTMIGKPEETEKKEVQIEREKQGLGEKEVKVEKPQELGWAMIEKPEEIEKKEVQVESKKKGLGEIAIKEIEVAKPQGQGWAMIDKPEETEKIEVTVQSEKQGLGEIELKEIQVEKPQGLGWAMQKKPEESKKKEVEVENEKQGLGEKEVKVQKPQEQEWTMIGKPEALKKKEVQVEGEKQGLGDKEVKVEKPQEQGWAMIGKPEALEKKDDQVEGEKQGLGDKEVNVEKPQEQGWAMIGKPEALEKKDDQVEGEKQGLGDKEVNVEKPQEQGWARIVKPEQSEKKEVEVESDRKGLGEIELQEIELDMPQEQGWAIIEKPEESKKKEAQVEGGKQGLGEKEVKVQKPQKQEWAMIGKPEALEKKDDQVEGEKQGLGDKDVKVEKPQEQGWAIIEKPEKSKKKEAQVEGEKQGLGEKEVMVQKPQKQEWAMIGKPEALEKKDDQVEGEKQGLGDKEVKVAKPQEQGWAIIEKPEEIEKKEVQVEGERQGLGEKEVKVRKPQEQEWAMIGKPEALEKKEVQVKGEKQGLGDKEVNVEEPQEQGWARIVKPEQSEKKEVEVESDRKGLGEIELKEIELDMPQEQRWAMIEKPEETEKMKVTVESGKQGLGEIELKEIQVEKPQEQDWAMIEKPEQTEKKEIQVESEKQGLGENEVKVEKPQEQGWAIIEKPKETEKKEVQVEGEKQGLGGKEVKVQKPQEQEWTMIGKPEALEKKEVQVEGEKQSLGKKEVNVEKPQEQGWARIEKPEESEKKEVEVESDRKGLGEIELTEIELEKPQEQGWPMIGKPEESEKTELEVQSDWKGLGEIELKKIELDKPQEQRWVMIEKPEETEKMKVTVESGKQALGEIELKEIQVEKPQEQGWDKKEKPAESEKKEVQVESERNGLGEIESKEIGVEKSQEREWIEEDVDAGKGKLLNSVKKELKVEGLEKNLMEEGVKMKGLKSNQSKKQSIEIGEVGLGDSKEVKMEAKDVEINKSISKDSEKVMLEPEDLKGGKTVRWEEQGLEAGIPKETNPGTESLLWSPERGFLWSSNPHTTEAVPDGLDEKNLPREDSEKKESGPSVLEALNPWEPSDIKRNEELQLPESNMWRRKGWADINIPAQKDDKESTLLGKEDNNDQSLTNNKLLQKKPIKIAWPETSNEKSSKSKETGSSIEDTYLKASGDLQKSDLSAKKVIAKKESSEDIAISKESGLILKNSKEGEKLSKQSENNGEIRRKLNKNDLTSDNGLIKPANVKTITLEQNMNKDETMVPDKNMGQAGSLSTIGSILTGSPSSSQRSDVSSDTSVEANMKLGDANKAIRWRGGNTAKAQSAENVNNDGTAAAITNDASTGADNQDKIEVSDLHPDLSKSREATHQMVPHSAKNNQHPLKIPREESEIEILKPFEENKQRIVAEDKSGIERLLDTGVKQDSLKEKTKEETSATDLISNQGKTLLTASKSEGNIVESEKVEEGTRETEKVAHEKDENYKILEDQNRKNTEKTMETGTNEIGQVSSKKKAEETKEITHGLNEKGNWKQGTTELSVNKVDNKVDLIENQDKDSRKMNMWKQLSLAQDVSSKSEEEITSKSSETIKQGSKIASSKEWMITDKKLQTSKERQVTKSIERNDNASKERGASSVVINQVAKEESQVEKTSEQNVAEDHLSKQRNSKVISNLSSEKKGREDKVEEEVSPTSKVSNVELKSASSTKDSVPELPKGGDIRVIKDGLRPEESDTHVWKQQKDEKEVSPNESESIKRLWDTKKASRGDVKSAEGNNVSEEKEQSSLASHALIPGKNEPWSPVLGVKSLEENDKSSWNKLNLPGDSRETKLNANGMAASNLRISAGKQLIEDNKQEVPSIISSPAALNTKTTGKARPPVANEDSIVRYLNEVVGATHTNEFESPRIEGTIRKGKLGNWAPIPLKKQQSGMISDKKDIEIEKEETKASSKSEDIVKDDKVKNSAPIPLTKQPSLNWNNKEDIEIEKQETKGSSKGEGIIRNDQVKKWPPNPLKKQPSINWNNKGDVELEKLGIKEPLKNEEIIRNDQIKKWTPKPLAKPVSVKDTSILNVPMAQKSEKQISKEEDQKLVNDELSDEDWNTGIVDKLHPASRNFAKPLRKDVNKNEWPESWESLKSGSNKSLENDSWTETVHRMIRSLLWIIRSWRIEKTVSDESDTKTSNAEIIKETSKESDTTNLDVYVVKWGQKGPVKVAAVNNMKPSIINKLLLPRKSYEEIRESYKKNAIKNIPIAA
nr:uncharacterized protein LOC117611905 isoform X1 [Osmia lignaria]